MICELYKNICDFLSFIIILFKPSYRIWLLSGLGVGSGVGIGSGGIGYGLLP
jgi:hypothetical protein